VTSSVELSQDNLAKINAVEYEAGPTLPPVPGIDLSWYCHSVIRRFANSAIGDTIARLCADTSDRIPEWMVPVVRQNVQSGGEVRRSATVIAAWTRYALGVDEQGRQPRKRRSPTPTSMRSRPSGDPVPARR
jgi:mannitol-1-phosphate/altronate dehydrogenase